MSRLKKLANVLEQYNDEYTNKNNQVTPYHILFKDHGNEIAALESDAAKNYCISTIDELNMQYELDDNFYKVTEEEKQQLQQTFETNEVDSGMDVLFIIKDFLLQTEGLEVQASRLRKTKK